MDISMAMNITNINSMIDNNLDNNIVENNTNNYGSLVQKFILYIIKSDVQIDIVHINNITKSTIIYYNMLFI